AGRADERPGRRHAARAGGGAARLPWMRRDHLPRLLVPRPRGHARARVRERLAGDLVRGQLRGLRGAPPRAARRGGRPAAPDRLQEAHARLIALTRAARSRKRRVTERTGGHHGARRRAGLGALAAVALLLAT